jgi:thioesterase domain-containing protein
VFKVNVQAAENYKAAKSAQPVILLQAADVPLEHAAETLSRWQKVAEVVETHRLPGDHYSMLTEPNVALLADKISHGFSRMNTDS